MTSFVHEFDTPMFKGKVNFPTGVYIDGKFSDGASHTTIECVFIRACWIPLHSLIVGLYSFLPTTIVSLIPVRLRIQYRLFSHHPP